MRRLVVLLLAVISLLAAGVSSANAAALPAARPDTARCSPETTGGSVRWWCHNDRTEQIEGGQMATPVFCSPAEDWSYVCGWLVTSPSWFLFRCYGGTVSNGPEGGIYAAWLYTYADYSNGNNPPYGYVSDAWISDDTTNVGPNDSC